MNYPPNYFTPNQMLYFAHDLLGREFGEDSAGWFSLEESRAVAGRCRWGWGGVVCSSERPTGLGIRGGPLLCLAVDTGSWLGAQLISVYIRPSQRGVPRYCDLLMVPGFPQWASQDDQVGASQLWQSHSSTSVVFCWSKQP